MTRRLVATVVLPVSALLLLCAAPFAAAGDVSIRDACTILGTSGNDRIVGTSGDDVICGLAGDDVIYGLAGDDTIYGGPDDDREFGGPGDDHLAGQTGADDLNGGPGDDILIGGGQKDDSSSGGTGDDTIDHVAQLGDDLGWYAGIDPTYDLPAGTTVKWSYLANSGRCLEDVKAPFTQTVGKTGVDEGRVQIFLTDRPTVVDSCAYESSRAWFGIEINTPSGVHRVGQVEVETGAANVAVWHVSTTCLYFGTTVCKGGSATVPALIFTPYAPVTIGPIS